MQNFLTPTVVQCLHGLASILKVWIALIHMSSVGSYLILIPGGIHDQFRFLILKLTNHRLILEIQTSFSPRAGSIIGSSLPCVLSIWLDPIGQVCSESSIGWHLIWFSHLYCVPSWFNLHYWGHQIIIGEEIILILTLFHLLFHKSSIDCHLLICGHWALQDIELWASSRTIVTAEWHLGRLRSRWLTLGVVIV